jgi:uncharacterized repeat protein (TIGR03803 family)
MKSCKLQLTLGLVLACIALTFSLAVCAQAQTFSDFVIFDGTNGSEPNTVIQATEGNLYGTTRGAEPPVEFGNVVRVSPTGEVTLVYTFCQKPHCADGGGTVFKMTPQGAVTYLYSFCTQSNCADGDAPLDALVQATNGNFYGTTTSGGNCPPYDSCGTIFEITPAGKFTLLFSFTPLNLSGHKSVRGPRAG